MKTAKELLGLRNKLEEEYKEQIFIKDEWMEIQNIIDNFKIEKYSTHIRIPKIKNVENENRLIKYFGFIPVYHEEYTCLYFDFFEVLRDCKMYEKISNNLIFQNVERV